MSFWIAGAGAALGLVGSAIQGGPSQQQNTYHNDTSSGSSSGTMTNNSTGSVTPNLSDYWKTLFGQAQGAVGTTGATPGQTNALNFLNANLTSDGFQTPAYEVAQGAAGRAIDLGNAGAGTAAAGVGQIGAGAGTVGSAINYLNNQQNNGSYTLGAYFGGQTPSSESTAPVQAQTGAAFMAPYLQPWNDVTTAAQNSYDLGADKAIGAFRAGNISYSRNDRTPLAQAAFANELGTGRAAVTGNLLGQGFTTAANLGQQDASRYLTGDTTNAQLGQQNNQFNANLTDSRQKFDLGQAETGEDRRDNLASTIAGLGTTQANIGNSLVGAGSTQAGIGGQIAGAGATGLNDATTFNNTRVGNANAVLNAGGMTTQQLLQLLGLSGAANGQSTTNSSTGTSNSTNSSTSSGTGTGNTQNSADVFGGGINGALMGYLLQK